MKSIYTAAMYAGPGERASHTCNRTDDNPKKTAIAVSWTVSRVPQAATAWTHLGPAKSMDILLTFSSNTVCSTPKGAFGINLRLDILARQTM